MARANVLISITPIDYGGTAIQAIVNLRVNFVKHWQNLVADDPRLRIERAFSEPAGTRLNSEPRNRLE